MRPIFGMSIKQNKYIDTDEDEQDLVFSDLPRQHTNEDESDDEDDLYGDQFEREEEIGDTEDQEEEIDEEFEKYKQELLHNEDEGEDDHGQDTDNQKSLPYDMPLQRDMGTDAIDQEREDILEDGDEEI